MLVNSCKVILFLNQVSKLDSLIARLRNGNTMTTKRRESLAIAFSFRDLANIIIMVITDFFKSTDFEKQKLLFGKICQNLPKKP